MADEMPLELDDELKKTIGGAFAAANWLTLAYNGEDGWPHISYRGSTHVHGPTQIAVWARKRDSGFAKAIARDPHVTFFHVDMSVPQLLTLYGRAEASSDQAVNERVYAESPEGEQQQDPEKKGVAIIIELDRIVAQGARNFVMTR
jgi:hypothetical protein